MTITMANLTKEKYNSTLKKIVFGLVEQLTSKNKMSKNVQGKHFRIYETDNQTINGRKTR
jgi:hypothetical protein